MKAGLTLYEVASEYRAMEARLRELDCDEQTIADTLEGESGDLIDKLCAVMAVALSMEAEAEQVQQYVLARAQARVSALNKRAERLRTYAKDAMKSCNVPRVEQPDMRFRLRDNPPSVVIEDEKKVPAVYWKSTTVEALDKKALADQLKRGQAVPGARIETKQRIELY